MVQWHRIALIDRTEDDRVLWSLTENFTEETMLGMVVAGHILLNEYRVIHDELRRYAFIVSSHELGDRFIIDPIDFPILNDFEIKATDDAYGSPRERYMRLWVWYTRESEYDVYGEGETEEQDYWLEVDLLSITLMELFLQGFISMCNAFQVDFRDYILGLPIDSNDEKYDLPSYRLREYFTEVKVDEEEKE